MVFVCLLCPAHGWCNERIGGADGCLPMDVLRRRGREGLTRKGYLLRLATRPCCLRTAGKLGPQKPRSHDTSRIAWTKLMARVGGGVFAGVPGVLELTPSHEMLAALKHCRS